MEASTFYSCLAFCTAFFAVFLLSLSLIQGFRSRIATSKAQSRSLSQNSLSASFVRNGIFWAKPVARLLLKFRACNKAIVTLRSIMDEKNIMTTEVNLLSFCVGALGIGALAFLMIGQSIAFALAASVCAVFIIVVILARQKDQRATFIREAIPDALRSMNVCFGAGLSLLQTFKQVASEIEDPLSSIFQRAANELETGKSTSEALVVFKESSVDELAFIAIALDVQHKVGGSMQQVIDTVRESVESEIALRRALRVQTAQAKMSANVVSIMPLLLIALFSLISQDFLAPFFQSAAGFALLAVAIAMQVGGILIVRKTLRIDVG